MSSQMVLPTRNNDTQSPYTPIRSHVSYQTGVEGVCHHSGRYLKRDEINPGMFGWLREQHDFPGFPELDTIFEKAVHSREFQHVVWSLPAIRGIALALSGITFVTLGLLLMRRFAYWQHIAEFALLVLLIALALIAGSVCLAAGIYLIANRRSIYHRMAERRPFLSSFPLLGSYKIDVSETIQADLSNAQGTPPTCHTAQGLVRIEVIPSVQSLNHYQQYHQIYSDPSLGNVFYAGIVAIDQVSHVTFTPAIEYGHRIVLTKSCAPYFDTQGVRSDLPLLFDAPYTIDTAVLYNGKENYRRFLLDVQLKLDPFDSYTLAITFTWNGDLASQPLLSECCLTIPPELCPITRVERGRIVNEHDESRVCWYRIGFQQKALTLRVTFGQPILDSQIDIRGMYSVQFTETLSHMHLSPQHIWNALGRVLREPSASDIRVISRVVGNLTLKTALLSQDHEYVFQLSRSAHTRSDIPTITTQPTNQFAEAITCALPPSHRLVSMIITLVTDTGIMLQRIEQASPRLDPAGTPGRLLHYWDLSGRYYGTSVSDAVDVHIVISGWENSSELAGDQSYIDVRVRALHDPRDNELQAAVDTTGEHLIQLLQTHLSRFETASN